MNAVEICGAVRSDNLRAALFFTKNVFSVEAATSEEFLFLTAGRLDNVKDQSSVSRAAYSAERSVAIPTDCHLSTRGYQALARQILARYSGMVAAKARTLHLVLRRLLWIAQSPRWIG